MRYAAHRLGHAALVLWAVTTLVFVLLRAAPAPVERILAGPRASAGTVAAIRRDLGLDRPLAVQYLDFAGRLARGDLGESYLDRTPVAELIADRLPITACLVLGAAVCWVICGVALGLAGAAAPRGLPGRVGRACCGLLVQLGACLPPFLVALLAVRLVAGGHELTGVGWLETGPPLERNFVRRMVLPWLCLAFLAMAVYAGLTRASVLATLGDDHIRTARAMGLAERRITVRHALRPAFPALAVQFGTDVGALLGGAIVIEQVFGLQGVGQLAARAIAVGDVPVICGVTVLATGCVVLAGLLADLAAPLLDPRVRDP